MNSPTHPDVYTHGHHESVLRSHRWRTAENSAAYLLPALVPGTRLLDVGCGSGALSVVAARAGADVTAIDLDPVAVAATVANATANGVAVDASTAPLSALDGSWDVVVANISARAVTELSGELWRVCAGTLVVSGILAERWSAVRDALGGTVLEVHDVTGWVTASVTRP